MSKHCRAKECPFLGCRLITDQRECVDCALMVDDDPLERAMDFDERKEPSPSEKAEIKSQIEALRKTYDMHKAEFLKHKRFIESEIAKLEKELMSAD